MRTPLANDASALSARIRGAIRIGRRPRTGATRRDALQRVRPAVGESIPDPTTRSFTVPDTSTRPVLARP